jgi:tRNA threonylcarbamoyladenosine biosynthesis protein TsaB
MRLLAIETATAVTAIALDGDGAACEVLVDDQRRHTEVLAPAIVALLAERGWSARDLDAVVVDVGPGLFTGLRVGVATAKGLSVATGVGLLAVSSTDALVAAACEAGVTGLVVAVVDARRREVFAAIHTCGPNGARCLEDVTLATPVALAARIARLEGDVVLVGDGAVRHRDVLAAGESRTVRDDLQVPSPGAAARLSRQRVDAGAAVQHHAAVHPWYLREADAVAHFAVREAP